MIGKVTVTQGVRTFEDAMDGVKALIQFAGANPNSEEFKDTPERVLKAYDEMFAGYRTDIESLFKTFDPVGYKGMVVVRDIQFYSTCAHHMLPFHGVAHVAYLPGEDGRILGLSKLARVVDAFARRLQVQERITQDITKTLMSYVPGCQGAACVIEAQHLCLACRGARKQTAVMVTSSLTGEFKKPEVRAEFLALIGKG